MEADIMVRPERLVIKALLLTLLFSLLRCSANEKSNNTPLEIVNADSAHITMRNGELYENDSLFSGILLTYYPETSDTAEISSYRNGREDGEWRKYYPKNILKEKRHFANGLKTGELLGWWENGNKKLHYFFESDEYSGTCREWNEEGLLTKQMNYEAGHEEGAQQWWYDNGKIKANYIIKDGRRYGLLGTKNCINVPDSVFKN